MDECPHCGKEIKEMYALFQAHDYATYFDIDCPHCEKPIKVEAIPVPDFYLKKKEQSNGA